MSEIDKNSFGVGFDFGKKLQPRKVSEGKVHGFMPDTASAESQPSDEQFLKDLEDSFDFTQAETHCSCEGFALHALQIARLKEPTKTNGGYVDLNAFRVDVPFRLTHLDGVAAYGRNFAAAVQDDELTPAGKRAWYRLAGDGSVGRGIETVGFGRYSAQIGFAALKRDAMIRQELLQIFRDAGCPDLTVVEPEIRADEI